MSNNKLDDILKRIPEIAKAVNEFQSPQLQERAFHALLKVAGIDEDISRQESPSTQVNQPLGTASRKTLKNKGKKLKSKTQGKKPLLGSYKIVDIDFHPEGKKSLKDFFAEKKPKSDPERYTTIIYYFKFILEREEVTKEEIYTAFKTLGQKVPNIEKGINNTKSRHAWIQFAGHGPITLTLIGENFVEHDLPPKTKEG